MAWHNMSGSSHEIMQITMPSSLTWAGSILMVDGLEDAPHCTRGRAILVSSYGRHTRHNLWQRGLACARPSPNSNPNFVSSLPSDDAASVSRIFDIGTVGHRILEVNEPHQTVFSSSDQEPDTDPASFKPSGRASFKPSAGRRGQQSTTTTLEVSDKGGASARLEVNECLENPSTIILDVEDHAYTWVVEPPSSASMPHLDMRDVQEFVRGVVEVCKRFENWGMPQTFWETKMPWHSPPPEILARGLERRPVRFASEEERLAFNPRARKRNPFLTGCPPTWSFIANLAFIGFLVYNPLG